MRTEPTFYAQVIWMDRRGAGRMRAFGEGAEIDRFLMRLRCEADIKNIMGEVIGNVWADDRDGNRGKWRWMYDPEQARLKITGDT